LRAVDLATDRRNIETAASALASGAIVGFPTETVYGLAANADDADAVARIYSLKNRPASKPTAFNLADPADVEKCVEVVPPVAWRLIERFWPGPLTLVLPGADGVDIGLRLPDHDATRAMFRLAGCRVTGTSANLSGEPPATSAEEVVRQFGERVRFVLDGGPGRYSQASTVAKVIGESFEILREGVISRAEIAAVIGESEGP